MAFVFLMYTDNLLLIYMLSPKGSLTRVLRWVYTLLKCPKSEAPQMKAMRLGNVSDTRALQPYHTSMVCRSRSVHMVRSRSVQGHSTIIDGGSREYYLTVGDS